MAVEDAAARSTPDHDTTRPCRPPPGWPTHALLTIAGALIVWGTRVPRGDLPFLVGGLIVGAMVILMWLVRALLLFASRRRESRQPGRARVLWAQWAIVPLSSAMLLLAVWLDVPFAVGFRMSRPAMQRAVAQAAVNQDGENKVWVGVYSVARIRSVPGGVELTIAGKDIPWGERGFYYSHTGVGLENPHYYDQSRIDDHWFIWHYGGW